jgi:DNA replication protein DnaC
MEVVPGKGARRCECRLPQRQSKMLALARIPPRYANCSFDNFHNEQHNTVLWAAFKAAKALVDDYRYPSSDKGLLFMGSVGAGKTHLSVAILQELLRKGVSCLFYDFGTLLKEIQDSYSSISNTSELSVLEPVFNAEVLVLDELGASKTTDWVRDTIMHIINSRYNNRKLTIITTNFLDRKVSHFDGRREVLVDRFAARRSTSDEPENDDQRPDAKLMLQETLSDRVGKRLRSRLYEMCTTIEMIGLPDYRESLRTKRRI